MQENAWGVSPFTLNFIKKLEGYTPKPKWDYKQHSVGYGTRWQPGQPMGTRADHEAALASEAGKVSAWLGQNVKAPMTENQRAAMISAGFNLGTGEKGLGRLLGDLNTGNWDSVARRLPSFNKAGGEVNEGLINRRAAEVEMLTGRKPTAEEMMARRYIGGTAEAPSAGPVPMQLPTAPTGRHNKLADALLASAAGAKPQGWGDLLNAAGDLALGYSMSNKQEEAEKSYRSKLAEALMGAKDTDALTNTLLSSGDPQLQNSAVSLKVAQMKPKSEIGRFRPTKQGVVDTTTGQIVPGTEAQNADQAEYGTSPQYYKDKDGNVKIGQLSKGGGMKPVDLPEGATLLPGIDYKDTGTELIGRDKRSGEIVTVQPKDVAGKESQEEIGKSQGLAQQSLPAAKTMVENSFKTIEELEKHPGIDTATGMSNVMDPRSWVPGTAAYDFLAKNKQATGQSFMAARDSLKGAGQLTDFEGAKGEQAIANLDAAQSKEQYLAALKTLKTMMQASYDDLQRKAGVSQPAQTTNPDVNSLKSKYGLE